MALAAGGAGAIGARAGIATPSSTIAIFTLGIATGAAAITVGAIVLDTRRIVPAVLDIVLVILGTVVLPDIVHPLQPFQVRAIAPAIVLLLQLFLPVGAIVRMRQVAVRGRAGGRRALCRPMEGTVRTRLRGHDPARMRPAVINVHRPLTLAPRKRLVRMHFPET